METMKALVLHGISDLRHEGVPIPQPGPGKVLLKVMASGICGSDIPRVFTKGTYHFPTIPGHEFAGEVMAVGPDTDGSLVGMRAAVVPLIPCGKCPYCEMGEYALCDDYDYLGSRCDGGFAEYAVVPAANLVPMPSGLSYDEAAMAEPAAVSLHAVRRMGVDALDTVVVLGAGPIGLITAQWCRLLGAGKVLMVDIDPWKLTLARSLGFADTCEAGSTDPVAWVRDLTGGMGADLVIEGAGTPKTLEQSLLMAGKLGRVVIMGNPSGDVTLPQATVSRILRYQLNITGTWNSSFSRLPKHEWKTALQAAADGRLRLSDLITHRASLADGITALEMMRDRSENSCKVLITP